MARSPHVVEQKDTALFRISAHSLCIYLRLDIDVKINYALPETFVTDVALLRLLHLFWRCPLGKVAEVEVQKWSSKELWDSGTLREAIKSLIAPKIAKNKSKYLFLPD